MAIFQGLRQIVPDPATLLGNDPTEKIVKLGLDLRRFQRYLLDAIKPLVTEPAFNFVTISNINLTSATSNVIRHGLGHQVNGWEIIRKNGQADVWDSQDANGNAGTTLILNTSADVVVSLRVY